MWRFVRCVFVFPSVAAAGVSSAFAQPSCDRACLRSMLDQYLNAVIKHDPAAAPLVVGFRQTENALNVRPGSGVWKTVTGLGGMQRRYVDAVTGQAAYYGIVLEGEESAIVTIRVRIENRKLTEAEWYFARANDPGLNGPRQSGRPPANLFNPEYLTANPPPERVIPPALRLPIISSHKAGLSWLWLRPSAQNSASDITIGSLKPARPSMSNTTIFCRVGQRDRQVSILSSCSSSSAKVKGSPSRRAASVRGGSSTR